MKKNMHKREEPIVADAAITVQKPLWWGRGRMGGR
jgi:hypothetical protein